MEKVLSKYMTIQLRQIKGPWLPNPAKIFTHTQLYADFKHNKRSCQTPKNPQNNHPIVAFNEVIKSSNLRQVQISQKLQNELNCYILLVKFRESTEPSPMTRQSKLKSNLNDLGLKQDIQFVQIPIRQQSFPHALEQTKVFLQTSTPFRPKVSALPEIKNDTVNTKVPQNYDEQVARVFNRSALGIQILVDSLKPLNQVRTSNSVIGIADGSKQKLASQSEIDIPSPAAADSKRFKQKEFQPSIVDIGVRGHMPFDDAPKQKNRGLPEGKRRSTSIIGNDCSRANRSQLGFHKTIGSMSTINQFSTVLPERGDLKNKRTAVNKILSNSNLQLNGCQSKRTAIKPAEPQPSDT